MKYAKSQISTYYKYNDAPQEYDSDISERVYESSQEFVDVLCHFLDVHTYVTELWRIKDILRQEQYVVREQYLSMFHRDTQYYRIRHYVVVPYYLVDYALSSNLSRRRCYYNFEFWSSVPYVRNSAIFVVNVITDNVYSTLFEPLRENEYYIDYIAYVE